MLEHMKHLGIKALADGGFQLPDDCGITGHSEDATVLIPHDILELYADEAKTEEKFLFNAQLSHIRARAEHLFDRNRLGRFNAFKGIWYMKLDFLFECVKVATSTLTRHQSSMVPAPAAAQQEDRPFDSFATAPPSKKR